MLTVIVHDMLVAMLPPVKLMLVEPATAAGVPPQVLLSPLGFETTSPVGSVSLNAPPASAPVFAAGFGMVKVSDVVPFNAMPAAPKALTIDGGVTTVSVVVLLVAPVPPSVEDTAPLVLLFAPAIVPVTSTENVHDDPAAGDAVSVPPDRLMLLVPATPVIVPLPHEPLTPLGVATTRP